jgi:hypothetical protein
MWMDLYTFQSTSTGKDMAGGYYPGVPMALVDLSKAVGGSFSLEGSGESEYLMKKSADGWGYPTIPIYRRK